MVTSGYSRISCSIALSRRRASKLLTRCSNPIPRLQLGYALFQLRDFHAFEYCRGELRESATDPWIELTIANGGKYIGQGSGEFCGRPWRCNQRSRVLAIYVSACLSGAA